ncbi:MAG: hypothetical protein WC843_03595 [Candidatus Gracilibacteria bacterium]|jgi:hypothetical protein
MDVDDLRIGEDPDVATKVDIGPVTQVTLEDVLRHRTKDFEKMAYTTWMESLTQAERESYDRLGFLFQLLHAVTQNREIIALSADERTAEKFSFTEVAELIGDVVREAESFLGPKDKELDRKENGIVTSFKKCYRNLVLLERLARAVYTVEEGPDCTTVIQFDADGDFLHIIENEMPKNLAAMVKLASERGDEPLKKTRAQERFMIDLHASDLEKEQILKAVEKAGKALKKIKNARAHGENSKILLPDDLQAIVVELGKVEHVRRLYVSNPGMSGQSYGIQEIQRLLQFVRNWEGTFRWVGGSKMAKMLEDDSPGQKEESKDETEEEHDARLEKERGDFLEKEMRKKRDLFKDFTDLLSGKTKAGQKGAAKSETKEEHDVRLEKEREKRRNIIQTFTDAFNLIMVAPLIVRRHRKVLRARQSAFRLVGETVETIEDKKLKEKLGEVIFQVSTILSYLDHMWDMHGVEKNGAGKHIVYPKKMILLGPLILGDVEKLFVELNYLSERFRKSDPDNGETDSMSIEDGMFADFLDEPESKKSLAGLGMNYKTSGTSETFRVDDVNGIVSAVHDDAVETAKPKPPESQKEMSISDSLNGLAMILAIALNGARADLRATHIKEVITNEEDDPENADAPLETLSCEIHDFIHDLYDALSSVLYEMTKIFKPDVTRHDVLPQSEAYEEQAACLRRDVIEIGTKITPAIELVTEIFEYGEEKRAATGLPMLQAALGGVAAHMAAFQVAQEQNLEEQKYHAVLRGASFEKMIRLANCSKDFKEQYCEELGPNTIELYVLRKQIDEFVEKTRGEISGGKLPNSGIIGAWMEDVDDLKKVEDRILANNLKPQELEKLQEIYSECFMHVLNVLDQIRKQEKVEHSYFDPNKRVSEHKVSEQVRGHFDDFAKANPMAEHCVTGLFTPIYFKFFKLMHLMSDFKQVCDLRRDPNTPEQMFLREYDMRKADVMFKENFEILMTYYAYPELPPEKKPEIMASLAECRKALSHLRFFDEKRAQDLDVIMADLERTLKSGHKLNGVDLEDFYLQFFREYNHNPIVVK